MSNHIEELTKQLADLGVMPVNKTYQSAVREAENRALQDTDERYPVNQGNTAVSEWIKRLLGYLAIAFVGLGLVGGLGLFLIFLPITEGMAVYAGFQYFAPDKALINAFSAASLVIVVIVLPFIKHLLADNLGTLVPKLTLRRTLDNVRYGLGLTDKVVTLTRAQTVYIGCVAAMFAANVTVLMFGFVGRIGTGSGIVASLGYTVAIFAYLMALDFAILFVYRVFTLAAGNVNLHDTMEERQSFLSERRDYYTEQALSALLVTAQARLQARNNSSPNNDEPTTS